MVYIFYSLILLLFISIKHRLLTSNLKIYLIISASTTNCKVLIIYLLKKNLY